MYNVYMYLTCIMYNVYNTLSVEIRTAESARLKFCTVKIMHALDPQIYYVFFSKDMTFVGILVLISGIVPIYIGIYIRYFGSNVIPT